MAVFTNANRRTGCRDDPGNGRHIQKHGEDAATESWHPAAQLQDRPSAGAASLPHQLQPKCAAAFDRSRIYLRLDRRRNRSRRRSARRCGLLHDIGKAADHETEGGHPKIGADLLKRYGEAPKSSTPRSAITTTFVSIIPTRSSSPLLMRSPPSSLPTSRVPGSLHQAEEELEAIARSFNGVEHAFAIQAGREVRVIAGAKDNDRPMLQKSATTSPGLTKNS